MFNERRQPSRGGTSRMTRECQVRFCEGLGVKFPGPTRHARRLTHLCGMPGLTPTPDVSFRRSERSKRATSGHHCNRAISKEV